MVTSRTLMSNILFAGAEYLWVMLGTSQSWEASIERFCWDMLRRSEQQNLTKFKQKSSELVFPYVFFRFTDYFQTCWGTANNFGNAPHLEWAHWPNLCFTRCSWQKHGGLPIPASLSKVALTVAHLHLCLLLLVYTIPLTRYLCIIYI